MLKPTSRRGVLGLAAGLGLVLLGWDVTRQPEAQWTAAVMVAGIDIYQAWLSPAMEVGGVRCRFRPTCSHYAEAVIRRDGALMGSWRTARRIARCGPWTSAGTRDQP